MTFETKEIEKAIGDAKVRRLLVTITASGQTRIAVQTQENNR